MRTVFFHSSRPASPSYGSSSPLRSPSPSIPRHTFSSTIMEENIENAESVIKKWDASITNYSKIESLFRGDRTEATEFLRSVKDLQSAMQFFVTEGGSSSAMIIRAQNLMQTAMKRLEKEFYQILSTNRNYLDPESVSSRASRASTTVSDFEEDGSEDEIQVSTTDSTVSEMAINDLKTIAESMISSGYTKECVKIYKLIRKSIVDESLYYLGVERLMSHSQFQKTDWEVIEFKIKNWLNAVKVAVKTIFHGEKILCDVVFGTSPVIQESCFADITRESAQTLIGFPEQVSKFTKLSPEKIFRVLDLYDSLSELWPEIEFIFSSESVSAVRSQAVTSLVKLGDAVRNVLSEFEAAIQKDASKSPVAGGGVHPLTRYVMNYIVFLSDYSGSLSDIVADWPLAVMSPLPESYFSSPTSDDSPSTAISVRLAWIVLVLLCKLDGKAELYKDVSLSYLFLANNLNYVVAKVRTSNLKLLLGDDWLDKHEIKVKQYASNYERMGWTRVMSSLPELNPAVGISITPEAAKECFRRFNKEFEEAYRKQTSWVVFDSRLRDEIKISLARKLVPAYREFYEKYRVMFRREMMGVESVVRYAPDDLGNYLSDLFYGTGASTSISSTSSSSSHSRERSFH